MRTDDFEEIHPQDTTDGIPDVVQAEQISDSFDEFGNPPDNKGKSLGELFRDNPFIKIAILLVGLVSVVVGIVMFGGSGEKEIKSEVATAIHESEAPGKETSEAYREAINEVNQQRLDQAVRTGGSTMPIPTNVAETPPVTPPAEEPPVNLEDPLDGWRATTAPEVPAQPVLAETDMGADPAVIGAPAVVPVPRGPDPAAIDALAQAMSQQMEGILKKHQISGPQIMQVTDAKTFLNPEGTNNAATTNEPPEVVEILIPAGTIVYAQTLTEANSDAPGPVLARLASGPLKGSKILGSFATQDEHLTLNFNTVVIKGISQSVNAIALDPRTTLPAVATEVDHRYWRRFVLPAAAKFIEGMGDAIAQREQTNVSVNGSTVTSSTPDLGTREEIAAGFAEGTKEIAKQLDQSASATKVLVKVHAGTPVGILFLEPVTDKQN